LQRITFYRENKFCFSTWQHDTGPWQPWCRKWCMLKVSCCCWCDFILSTINCFSNTKETITQSWIWIVSSPQVKNGTSKLQAIPISFTACLCQTLLNMSETATFFNVKSLHNWEILKVISYSQVNLSGQNRIKCLGWLFYLN
jgi:hypothetical protein